MLKRMRKQLKNEKGLTLVELLAVIVILGIIAAIAVPAIGNIIENSRYNAVKADALNVLNAAQLYYTENPKGEIATDAPDEEATTTEIKVSQLKTAKYLESAGQIPDEATVTLATRALTADDIDYSGTKKVTFTNATIDIINADDQKGSADGDKTITGS